jgi:hypothetical protein
MATELHRVIQFDGITVAQYNEASDEVVWKACEVRDEQKSVPPPDIPADESLTKWVYDRQQPLVISSLEQETRFPRMVEFLREKRFESSRSVFCPSLRCIAVLAALRSPAVESMLTAKKRSAFSR